MILLFVYFFYLRQLRNCLLTRSLHEEKVGCRTIYCVGFFAPVTSCGGFWAIAFLRTVLWSKLIFASIELAGSIYVLFIKRQTENPRLRFLSFSLSQKSQLWSPAIFSHLLSSAIVLTWGVAPVPEEDGFFSLIADLACQRPAALLITL